MTNLKFDINLTKKQQEAYDTFHRIDCNYLVCKWSRQSGKSVFAEIILIEYLCKNDTFNAYISPTFALGRKVYSELIKMLDPTGIIKKANASTLTIESVYGSTLQFFSVEGYTAIRGNTVSGVLVLDEAAYYPEILPNGENIWANVIYPITKARKPKTLIISTPFGKQGFFYTFYNRAMEKRGGYYCISASIYDDSLVTEEEIEEIKQSMPTLAFKQEFLVEFLDNAMTFFTGFEQCFSKQFTFNENIKTYIGVDPSGTGDDECIVTKVNEKLEVKQYAISGNFDTKHKKIAEIINSTKHLEAVVFEINGLGSPMFNETRKLVKNKLKMNEFITSNASKERIISNLASLIEQNKIHFNKDDTALYSQFSTFQAFLSKTKHLILQGKQGSHDDRIMSLAMAVEAMNIKKNFHRSQIGFGTSKNTFIG